MKKLMLILALLIGALPTIAANYETLYNDVAAATSNALSKNWNKLSVNGNEFILTGKSFRNNVYELVYKEDSNRDMGSVIYIRFYPNVDKMEGDWTTDENLVEYVSKGVYNPSSNGGEEKEMFTAELGNNSIMANRKFLTNGGMLQVSFIDFKTTRAQIKNKKGYAMNLIALVANVPTPMSYEIQQMVGNK